MERLETGLSKWVQLSHLSRSTCKEYVDYMEALQNQVLQNNKRHLR